MWDDGTTWAGARAGELRLRACHACGAVCHPPLPMCPHCQSLDWDTIVASGQAVLKSWLVSIRPDQAGEAPRIVAVADLAEGVRFVTNLIDTDLASLHEGLPLELCFAQVEGEPLPQFRIDTSA